MRPSQCYLVALCLTLAVIGMSNAQLVVHDANTGGETAQSLAHTLLGSGSAATIIGTPTLTGDARCTGSFTGGLDAGLGFAAGILLSSGRVLDVVGPNTTDRMTTGFGTPGDPFLDGLIPGFKTFDACILEFQFQCSTVGSTTFQYQFVSEEYNEFSNSLFNNVFGFALNGTNIALLTDGVTPVSINNVNGGNPSECRNGIDDDGDTLIDAADPDCTTPNDNIVGENNFNSAFFINNDCNDLDGGAHECPLNIEADGLTVAFTATGKISTGPNTIRLAIGDAGDSVLDSWVFLQAGSFTCVAPLDIDVKPGSFPNCFNVNGHGVIPVAMLGSADFDVAQIDVTSLSFEGAEVRVKGNDSAQCSIKDVSGDFTEPEGAPDGFPDLVCQFVDDGDLTVGRTTATLTGRLLDGTVINGSDEICIMP